MSPHPLPLNGSNKFIVRAFATLDLIVWSIECVESSVLFQCGFCANIQRHFTLGVIRWMHVHFSSGSKKLVDGKEMQTAKFNKITTPRYFPIPVCLFSRELCSFHTHKPFAQHAIHSTHERKKPFAIQRSLWMLPRWFRGPMDVTGKQCDCKQKRFRNINSN